mgnify:FL=1
MRRENWMSYFQNKSIHELVIPGSHDSFAYDFKILGPNESGMPRIANLFIKLWAKCQSKTIYEQLLMGIRYFDIRLTKYNGEYYTIHSLIAIPVNQILHDILLFIDTFPTEKIILDFNHLYIDDVKEFEEYLKFQIGDKAVSNNNDNIIAAIGTLDKPLFVFVDDDNTSFFNSDILKSFWHDTNDVNLLTTSMSEESKEGLLRITQAILTPTQTDVLLGIFLFFIFPSSLKALTYKNKQRIYDYLELDIQNKNIIITDFVDEDYVDLCIRENVRRAN